MKKKKKKRLLSRPSTLPLSNKKAEAGGS
jgi:hypothetical protein